MRLEETGKRIRVRGHLADWPVDRIVDEILRDCPNCSLLEGHRLAHGLTRQQLSWAVDALYEADGLAPPHLDPSDIWAWERGRHQPTGEHQRYLTRAYRTRPDRLGFGEDHSPRAQEGAHGSAPAQSVSAAASDSGTSILPGPAGADELVVAVSPGIRVVALRLPTASGGGAQPRLWLDLPRWSPEPGALVGLTETRIEIVVSGTMERVRRSEHGVKVMDRRAFLTLGIALPVAVTVDHLERLSDVLTTSRVDALAVEGLERIAAGCRRAWDHVPARELLPHVEWQMRLLEGLRPTTPALQSRVVALAGSMAALAGRMTFWDLQDSQRAEGFLRTALTAAQESDDRELSAYTLATWSYVAAARTARLTTASGNGPLTGAVHMVDEARRLATASGSLTTEAWVAAAASEIHACSGDEPSCRRSIEHADRLVSRRPGDDPLWIGHGTCDAIRIRAYDSVNLMRFNKPEAVDALRWMLSQYTSDRRALRCFDTGSLARALVQQGEVVEGTRYAGEALTLAVELGSGENVRRLRTLYSEDLHEHRDHSDVRALGDRLTEL